MRGPVAARLQRFFRISSFPRIVGYCPPFEVTQVTGAPSFILRTVVPSVCLTVTCSRLDIGGHGAGMCSTECHSSEVVDLSSCNFRPIVVAIRIHLRVLGQDSRPLQGRGLTSLRQTDRQTETETETNRQIYLQQADAD